MSDSDTPNASQDSAGQPHNSSPAGDADLARHNQPNHGQPSHGIDQSEPTSANRFGTVGSSDYTADIGNTDAGFQPLDPRFVSLERLSNGIVTGVVTVGAMVGGGIGGWATWDNPPWNWIIIGGCLALILLLAYFTFFWPKISYRHIRWRLNEVGMEIQRGVLWKHRLAIPLARVQHVDVSQGPMQRMYSLGTITIHTAGTSNASILLTGLEHSVALELRDQLIRQKEALDVT